MRCVASVFSGAASAQELARIVSTTPPLPIVKRSTLISLRARVIGVFASIWEMPQQALDRQPMLEFSPPLLLDAAEGLIVAQPVVAPTSHLSQRTGSTVGLHTKRGADILFAARRSMGDVELQGQVRSFSWYDARIITLHWCDRAVDSIDVTRLVDGDIPVMTVGLHNVKEAS